jgi:hypothetical protein
MIKMAAYSSAEKEKLNGHMTKMAAYSREEERYGGGAGGVGKKQ